MSPEVAWELLNDSLERYAPPCDGEALFTAEGLSLGERSFCARLCARCSVLVLCDAYATAAKVDSGFWAGTDRSPKWRRNRTDLPTPITRTGITS